MSSAGKAVAIAIAAGDTALVGRRCGAEPSVRARFRHYDVEVSGSDREPRQVEFIGPVAQVFTYSIVTGLMFSGPVLALTSNSLWSGLSPAIIIFPLGMR